MRIAEIYHSIQGEGQLTGTPSTFIRSSGCNLRCWFCDTPFTSWQPEGDDLSVDEIVAAASAHPCPHVVITGGEPMLYAELIPLTEQLAAAGMHITIETAGTLYLPVHCDLMSISPKLATSAPSPEEHPRWYLRHQQQRHRPNVVRRLMEEFNYQLKFVVDDAHDCTAVEAYLRELSLADRQHVWLMPQGIDLAQLQEKATWLKPYCHAHGYRLCPRMQIEWFGARRGT